MSQTTIGPAPVQTSPAPTIIEDRGTAVQRAAEIRRKRAEERRIAKAKKAMKRSKRNRAEYGKLEILSTIRTVRGDSTADELIAKLSIAIADCRTSLLDAQGEEIDKLAGTLLKLKAQLSIAEKAQADKSGENATLQLANAEILVVRQARALCAKSLKNPKLMHEMLVFLERNADLFGTAKVIGSKVR